MESPNRMANISIGASGMIGTVSCDTDQAGAPAPLEDRDDDAVGGTHAEHVEHRGLQRHQDRAEHDHQDQEGQPDDGARK